MFRRLSPPESSDDPVGFLRGRLDLVFQHHVEGYFVPQLGDRLTRRGHHLQDQAHRRKAVPAGMDFGVDDPAVPFAADDRSRPAEELLRRR